MFTVVLGSQSTRADVTPAWLAKVAAAIDTQLKRDFCPDYGLASWSCTTDPTVPGPRVVLFDHGDQANIMGVHSLGPDDQAQGAVFAGMYTLDQISSTLSHEVLELVGDLAADRFRFPAASALGYAEEASDAVEDLSYPIDEIAVSDFVTPAWYDPSSKGPWDHLGALTAPLTKTDGGGYWIERKPDGTVDTNPPEAKARPDKAHALSRTSRRLARAAGA